jgi:Xaa-Pro aminopeptidase
MTINSKIFKERRQQLLDQVQAPVLLVGAFEDERTRFHQASSFYYFAGVVEPGSFCLIEPDGRSTLFIPSYKINRAQWIPGALEADESTAQEYGFDWAVDLGEPVPSYLFNQYFEHQQVKSLLHRLTELLTKNQKIYTVLPSYVIDRLTSFAPELATAWQDVSKSIATMRRKKDKHEIAALYDAAQVTMIAQEAAARAIAPGINECQVEASINYIFTEAGAQPAFPSIVGSGFNATVLHYTDNCKNMEKGECAVVDIGACLKHYCGDITRTYPVSGTFTDRQKEVYQAVLDAHEHVAAVAQPGYYLRNEDQPEKSLHHLALEVLRTKGLDQYFVHGIGHFLGLDVHDVGNIREPLEVGDVITIEPGVYIPEESLGVRLEDNYWIVEDGAVCLTEDLPKDIASVEKMVQASLD